MLDGTIAATAQLRGHRRLLEKNDGRIVNVESAAQDAKKTLRATVIQVIQFLCIVQSQACLSCSNLLCCCEITAGIK